MIERGKGEGVGLNALYDPVRGVKHVDWGVDYMCKHIDDGELDMDPDYQRDHVWTVEQQMDFVGFLMEGGRQPEVFVRELPYMNSDPKPPYYEIVDGKQRLTALHAWYNDKIPAQLSEEHGRRQIWMRDLTKIELVFARRNMNSSIQFLHTDRKATLRIYLRLNRGGTPHTDAEIARVRKLYESTVRCPGCGTSDNVGTGMGQYLCHGCGHTWPNKEGKGS